MQSLTRAVGRGFESTFEDASLGVVVEPAKREELVDLQQLIVAWNFALRREPPEVTISNSLAGGNHIQ
mgnify:CR=1 FL=1